MLNLWRWFAAKWTLGWALAKNILRIMIYGVRGPKQWLSRIAGESLGAVPPEAWSYFRVTSGCIGCGVCDAAGRPGERPSQWITQVIRQPSDSLLAVNKAKRLRDLSSEISRLCPQGVDSAQVARLIEDNSRMLKEG